MAVLTVLPAAGPSIYGSGDLSERQALQTMGGLTLVAPATVLAGATAGDFPWGSFNLPSNGFSRLQAMLNVSAAATAAGDTLDVFIDSSPDEGTTWTNIIHFTQVLGNGGAVSFIARTAAAAAGAMSTTTADQTAGATPLVFAGNSVRVRTKRAQTSAASFTVNLVLTLLP